MFQSCNHLWKVHNVSAALEMAWHPYFNPGTANTRMDYEHPLNRPLFIALFKQTQASSDALSDCCKSVSATFAECRTPFVGLWAGSCHKDQLYYNTQTYMHNVHHAINTHFTITQVYKVQIQAIVHVLVMLNF